MYSVIIPLYNKENCIAATIRSVLNQTFRDFEIIVVDDSSTDQSAFLVKQFNDPRIHLIHQKNQGVSAARNTGIRAATQKWIAFLDADDLWEKNHLEEYTKVINENPQLNWIISGFTIVAGPKKEKQVYKKNGVLNNVFDDLLNSLSIHTSTVCVRSELFDKYDELLFRVGLNNSEDREVWYKLGCIDRCPFYISQSLSEYDAFVPNSLTTSSQHTRNEHYLTMEYRLQSSTLFKNIPINDQNKIRTLIRKINKQEINGRFVEGVFNKKHKEHLSLARYTFFSVTAGLPRILKKIIIRILRH